MNSKQLLVAAGSLGLLSVALGAFGAHALKDLLSQYGRSDTFELGVRYQMYHALVLLFLGLDKSRQHGRSALLFLVGIFLFSGSLYFLSLTNSTALVLITPIGGTFLIAAWASVIITFLKSDKA